MRLLITIILVLMLSSLAFAAPETRQLGPYTVSLSMNTSMNYQVQTPNPAVYASATIYPLIIATNNVTGASISIIQYKNLTDSTLQANEDLTATRMVLSGINVTVPVEQVIDGKNGFLISGMPITGMSNAPSGLMFYHAQYWLDSKNCECGPISVGTTLVDIASTYPQNVTQGILSSIHVAKGQAPSLTPGMNLTQASQQSTSTTY